MTPAQKAAAEIRHKYGKAYAWGLSLSDDEIAEIIQSIMDVAMEQRKQRELEVAAHWRYGPIGLTEDARKLYVDYRATCVIELESLAKEK